MATLETVKVTLEDLTFPDFGDDKSKKNFRILVTFTCLDADDKPGKIMAALPPLDQDDWQWRKSGKDDFVPNDGKGHIFVDQIKPPSKRVILFDKTDIRTMNVKILDIADKNFLDFAGPILKGFADVGLGAATGGLSGVFLKLFKPVSDETQKEVDKLIDKLVKNGDKVLYEDEVEGTDNGHLKDGSYTLAGQGVLHKRQDGLGKYSITIKIAPVV